MTLYINGRFLTQPLSGVQRYSHALLHALDDLLGERSDLAEAFGPVRLLTPFVPLSKRTKIAQFRNIEISHVGSARGHIWEQSTLFRVSRDGVLLSLGNSGPLAHPAHIVAFHDAHVFEMPEAFSARYRQWHRFLRPRLARNASRLITVSCFSADRLAEWLGVDAARFSIVPNSADHMLKLPAGSHVLDTYELSSGQYFLAVGNQSPNKNIAKLITAHRAAGDDLPELVLVGGAPLALDKAKPDLHDRVRSLGRVPDADLRSLYTGSAGFVFPSLNEGFGIPPLEAMQLGVPVLSSNRSAMPEVLGQAPLWCDPTNEAALIRSLQQFSNMTVTERAKRVELGLERARVYSWKASALRLGSVLHEVFAERGAALARPDDMKRTLRRQRANAR